MNKFFRAVLLVTGFSNTVIAEEVPLFKVNTIAYIKYDDGNTITISKEGPVEIEGFSCTLEYSAASNKNNFFGVGIGCRANGGIIYVNARCDSEKPGYSLVNVIGLQSDNLQEGKFVPLVLVGCETTYTRLPSKVPNKTGPRSKT
jgi:hypothetical protein